MHVIEYIGPDGESFEHYEQERDAAYRYFDDISARLLPGWTLLMREDGKVHRRFAVPEDTDASTDVSETATADGDVGERAGGKDEGAGGRGGTAPADPDVRGTELAAPQAKASLAPKTVAKPDPAPKKKTAAKKP